jgi:hypothetical protein
MERDPDTGLLELKQEGLTLCIIKAMGLDVGTVTPKWMLAEAAPLAKDTKGAFVTGAFSYSSVVGMLLHHSGHTCPDIANAVNCKAQYMFCPKKSHEEALKQIGRYLKAIYNHLLIIKEKLSNNSHFSKKKCMESMLGNKEYPSVTFCPSNLT